MQGSLLLLGTGGSLGIPMVGCPCGVCHSQDPKNKRMRSSALVHFAGDVYLIDSGPDIRNQALKYHINHLDGIILTHAHYDHTAGLDDLRPLLFRRSNPLPALMSKETYAEVQMRFNYFLDASPKKLEILPLPSARGEYSFVKLPLSYFTYEQTGMSVNGFRFGNLAYVSDIKNYEESLFQDLAGVEFLVLSALRHQSSIAHLTVDEAVAFAERCGATMTYLTHISHELDHEKTDKYLPSNVQLAYDGLAIDFEI